MSDEPSEPFEFLDAQDVAFLNSALTGLSSAVGLEGMQRVMAALVPYEIADCSIGPDDFFVTLLVVLGHGAEVAANSRDAATMHRVLLWIARLALSFKQPVH